MSPVPRPSYPMLSKGQFQSMARESGIQDDGPISEMFRRVMDKQAIDERLNYQWIADNMGGGGSTSRSSTVVVAASDAQTASQEGADYVCTGAADEVTIQTALDHSYPGGLILLTEGSFVINNPLNVPEATTIHGYGTNNTIIYASGTFAATSPMIRSASAGTASPFNISIRHLSLIGQSFAQDGIRFKQGAYIVIEDIEINDVSRYGIAFLRTAFDHTDHVVRDVRMTDIGTACIYGETLNRGRIEDCILFDAIGISVLNGSETIIAHNSITPDTTGILVTSAGNMSILGNRIDNPTDGISLVSADTHTIQGNRINSATTGINVTNAACDDNFITVNDLFNCTTALTDSGTGTIKINNRGDDI